MEQLVGLGEFHRTSRLDQAHRSTEMIVNRCALEQTLLYPFPLSCLIISPLQDYRQIFYQEYTAKNRYQQLFVDDDGEHCDDTANGEATALGNGGVFCWYSYINPMLTNVSGFSAESITPLMILAGFGMVVGNLISGRLSDRYTPGKVGTAAQALICIMLLLIFFLSPYKWAAALLMCLCTAGLFAVSSPEQILIIRVSKGGEMLGAACVQVVFNLGNAIGAYAGGLAVSGGYRYPALAGVPFALIGFTLFLIFYKKYQARITEDDIIEND